MSKEGVQKTEESWNLRKRKWLPPLNELIDRLSIVQLKMIFIPEHSAEYAEERELLLHDIGLLMSQLPEPFGAQQIMAVQVVMLANRVIWENESKARLGGSEQDKLLKFTHSINGVRNKAKNIIAEASGGRKDHKLDCLAAELPPEFGQWDIFK